MQTSSDQDSDMLTYRWYLDNNLVSNEQNYSYFTDYTSSGLHNITLIVSDGISEASKGIVITVNNINRAPIMDLINNITITEGELIAINPIANDPDNDNLIFIYASPLNSTGQWRTKIGDKGIYSTIVSVTDGIAFVNQNISMIINEYKTTVGSGGGGGGGGSGSDTITTATISEPVKEETQLPQENQQTNTFTPQVEENPTVEEIGVDNIEDQTITGRVVYVGETIIETSKYHLILLALLIAVLIYINKMHK